MKKLVFVGCLLAFLGCDNTKKDKKNEAIEIPKYVEQLAKKVTEKPDSVGLRFNLINVYDSIGAYKLAIAELDSLIFYDKGNYALWFKKAQVFEHAGDTASAIKNYNLAATIYAAPECLLALANLYAETKNKTVFEVCKQVDNLRLGRNYNSYTDFFVGVYYARIGNKQLAFKQFDKSIVNNYLLMDAYMEKGYLLYDEKKFADALQIFKQVTTINNLFVDGYYWQAKCFEALQQKKQALEQYQVALNLNKNLIEAEEAILRLNK